MHQSMEPYKQDLLTFIEAGFVAVNSSDEEKANKLFAAAEAIDPNNELIAIGRGYMQLCKLQLKAAEEAFKKVLEKHPNSEMAKSMLGLTLVMTPNKVSEGEKILHESSQASDKEVQKLSKDTQQFVDQFVKKNPSPGDIRPGS